jgi:ATP-dependent Clp protease ATP-binding subunit ClpA
MDHATLTDNNGKKADFRNVILMMTSNAGAREMSSQTIGFGDVHADTEFKGIKAIEKMFSPEFRNRLDEIITFNALSLEIMEMIVDKFMLELNDQLAGKRVTVDYSDEIRTYLAKKGHDPRYGARPLSRVIQTEIKDALSDEILFGQLSKGGTVFVDLKDGELTFSYARLNSAKPKAEKAKAPKEKVEA